MYQLLLLLVLLLPTLTQAGQITEYKLDNGLKLLVKEDHRAPVVVSQICYKVGSSYEHGGITGISHALEHMMFKGTAKHQAGEFSRIMATNGAVENAYTSIDHTCYYQELAADKLPLSFELESDRMQNLTLSPDEFSKEIQVVMEERRMRTDDNPQGHVYERFNAAAFVSSPYHHLTIGWMNDLQHMTADDLRQWYKTWYSPNNATLVVIGDVKPTEVLKLAKQYFDPVPAATIARLKPQSEIAPEGERNLVVKIPAKLPLITMGYNVPTLTTANPKWEAYALEVLAGILDAGDSSRLPKELVRGSQIATDVDVTYSLYSRLDTLFTLSVTPAAAHILEEIKSALLAQIKRLQEQKVDPQELDRVKTQLVANKFYALDSITEQAEMIGLVESIGLSWLTDNKYAAHIRSVTPDQIQTVARRYFIPERLTVALLQPLPTTTAQQSQNLQGERYVH